MMSIVLLIVRRQSINASLYVEEQEARLLANPRREIRVDVVRAAFGLALYSPLACRCALALPCFYAALLEVYLHQKD